MSIYIKNNLAVKKLHSLYLAGYAGVDRHAQALAVADLLTHGDQIPLFHQGLTGRADVLRHGQNHDVRLREVQQRRVFGVEFVFFRMDASKEGKRHNKSPLHWNLQVRILLL